MCEMDVRGIVAWLADAEYSRPGCLITWCENDAILGESSNPAALGCCNVLSVGILTGHLSIEDSLISHLSQTSVTFATSVLL